MEKVTKESLLEIVINAQGNFEKFKTVSDLKTKVEKNFDFKNNKSVDPLQELQKLSKLVKAHTTKLGILLSKFDKNASMEKNIEKIGIPSLKELTDLSNSVWYILSLLKVFHENSISADDGASSAASTKSVVNVDTKQSSYPKVFVDELDTNVLILVINVNEYFGIFKTILEDLENVNEKLTETRLICIGKVWSICDKIIELASSIPKVIINHINTVTMKLLSDTLVEVEEWLEDPTLEDLDDPFGLNYSDEEEEDEEEENEDDGDKDEVPLKMIEFMETWQNKIKLIKLLMNSLKLSLSKSVTSTTPLTPKVCHNLQSIYELQKEITVKVDDLISTVFFANNKEHDDPLDNKDITDIVEDLNTNTLMKICKTVVALNANTKKNTDTEKWIDTWKNKYFQ